MGRFLLPPRSRTPGEEVYSPKQHRVVRKTKLRQTAGKRLKISYSCTQRRSGGGVNWFGLCSTGFSSGGKKHLRVSKGLAAGVD